jgi:hypothetical protein
MLYLGHKVGPISRRRQRRAAWLGRVGGFIACVFAGRPFRVTCDDLKAHEYRTSTQRMGVRFTERIRNTFRFRWLRQSR